jgi:hypothetical protein
MDATDPFLPKLGTPCGLDRKRLELLFQAHMRDGKLLATKGVLLLRKVLFDGGFEIRGIGMLAFNLVCVVRVHGSQQRSQRIPRVRANARRQSRGRFSQVSDQIENFDQLAVVRKGKITHVQSLMPRQIASF